MANKNNESNSFKVSLTHYTQFYQQSGDQNPLHRDLHIAKSHGFEAPVLYGFALIEECLRRLLPESSGLQFLKVQFFKPTYVGMEIHLLRENSFWEAWDGEHNKLAQFEFQEANEKLWAQQVQALYRCSRLIGNEHPGTGALILSADFQWDDGSDSESIEAEAFFAGRVLEVHARFKNCRCEAKVLRTENYEVSIQNQIQQTSFLGLDFKKWKNKKILILGGSQGYGLCWGTFAKKAGAQVVGLCRTRPEAAGSFPLEEIDFRDPKSFPRLQKLLEDQDIVMLNGLLEEKDQKLVELLATGLKPSAQIYFSSSQFVQGFPDEINPTEKLRKYVADKKMTEKWLQVLPENQRVISYLPAMKTRFNAFQTQWKLQNPIEIALEEMRLFETRLRETVSR